MCRRAFSIKNKCVLITGSQRRLQLFVCIYDLGNGSFQPVTFCLAPFRPIFDVSAYGPKRAWP